MSDLGELAGLIRTLRGENGCPWDRRQTAESLGIYIIEEMYELIDAIRLNDPVKICEELGDVFFQLVFVAEIFREKGLFSVEDSLSLVTEKMIRRHPHVFGDESINSVEGVKKRWKEIKKTENSGEGSSSVLDSVPVSLPAMMRAAQVSERAAGEGFDWEDISGVLDKVVEEIDEFRSALKKESVEKASIEFGDIIFTLVNVARFAGFHPETAVAGSTAKFEKRYRYMEAKLKEDGLDMKKTSREEIDRRWEEAKKKTE